MNKKQKEETIEVFAEAFHDVVVPVLEDFRNDFNKRVDNIEEKLGNQIEHLDRKITNVTNHQSEKLDNHEKRIKKLEVKTAVN